jgi:hypothetical protein
LVNQVYRPEIRSANEFFFVDRRRLQPSGEHRVARTRTRPCPTRFTFTVTLSADFGEEEVRSEGLAPVVFD